MASQTVTVTYVTSDPSACTFSPAGPYDLDEGDTLTINFSGFPSASTLTQLRLTGISGNVITYQPASNPPQGGTANIFTITANNNSYGPGCSSPLVISVEDIEDPGDDDTYDLALTGGTGSGSATWTADPQVVNQPGT